MLNFLVPGLAFFAEGRYIVSILKGRTRPSFASWLVFAVSMGSVFASAYALEARASLYLIGTFATLNIIITILAFRFGVRSFSRMDIIFLALSAIGILLWWGTSNPWYALLISAAVDAIGYLIMFRKLSIFPGTEDSVSWASSTLAYMINLFLIVHWVPQEYLFSLLNVLWCSIAFFLSFFEEAPRPCV